MTDANDDLTYPPTETIEDATEAGYLGAVVDQTPNEEYTVEGVTADPEPKADSKSKSKSTKGGDG